MLGIPRSRGARRQWVWRVATLAALLAQCWIALAPLAEGRGLGAPAHVEGAGTSRHYAHDEADCAACAVMALQPLASAPPVTPDAPPVVRAARAVERGPVRLESSPHPLSQPRAPPVAA